MVTNHSQRKIFFSMSFFILFRYLSFSLSVMSNTDVMFLGVSPFDVLYFVFIELSFIKEARFDQIEALVLQLIVN